MCVQLRKTIQENPKEEKDEYTYLMMFTWDFVNGASHYQTSIGFQ